MWFDNSASTSASNWIFSPIQERSKRSGFDSFSSAAFRRHRAPKKPPPESKIHAAGEVELIQRVLQRLDFGVQLGDEFVHVHLADLGDVFDFVTRVAEASAFVEHAGLGVEAGQRGDEALEFRQAENLVVDFRVGGGDGSLYFD